MQIVQADWAAARQMTPNDNETCTIKLYIPEIGFDYLIAWARIKIGFIMQRCCLDGR